MQWSLSKVKTHENDKLVFHTWETFLTVLYGLVSGSYANKVAPPRFIIIKDVQLDMWNLQNEKQRERSKQREKKKTRDIKEPPTKWDNISNLCEIILKRIQTMCNIFMNLNVQSKNTDASYKKEKDFSRDKFWA